MTIIVKDFEWKQSQAVIIITVPSKGIHQSKVDMFHSERYIKANYEQYFFEVILLHSVDISKSKCTITPTSIVLELEKIENVFWEMLEPNVSKTERNELKLWLIKQEHENFQKKCEEDKSKKAELKRIAVREQIKIDTQQRETVQNIKNKEKTIALGDMTAWHKEVSKKTKSKKRGHTLTSPTGFAYSELPSSKDDVQIPLPRSVQSLEINFTPRVFPTPIRESKLEEENEWLKKQAEARRTVGFVSEDLRPEEKNPQFLKAKGDEFMKNHNYLGALSAYSFAIKLSDKLVDLYIARSEANYEAGNFNKCALDCNTALELMKPVVEGNLEQRAICIGRRGMALCKLGYLSQGIDEIEASLKLVHNEELKKFFCEAEKEWMNKDDSN